MIMEIRIPTFVAIAFDNVRISKSQYAKVSDLMNSIVARGSVSHLLESFTVIELEYANKLDEILMSNLFNEIDQCLTEDHLAHLAKLKSGPLY